MSIEETNDGDLSATHSNASEDGKDIVPNATNTTNAPNAITADLSETAQNRNAHYPLAARCVRDGLLLVAMAWLLVLFLAFNHLGPFSAQTSLSGWMTAEAVPTDAKSINNLALFLLGVFGVLFGFTQTMRSAGHHGGQAFFLGLLLALLTTGEAKKEATEVMGTAFATIGASMVVTGCGGPAFNR